MQILCATDFSASGRQATRLGAALARRLDAKLVLLHVVEPLAVALPYPVDLTGQLAASIADAAASAIAADVDELRKEGCDVEGKVLLGAAGAVIAELAAELNAELLVVGSHGRSGVARLFLGSVAAWLMKAAPCPVLVCTAGSKAVQAWQQRWQGRQPLRLLLGTDATRASAAAVDWMAAAAPAIAADVHLLRLYWPFQEAVRYGLRQGDPRNDSPSDLIKLVERDLARELPASLQLGEDAIRFREAHVNAAEVLADAARALAADAIVVGVPRHGLEKWNAIVPEALLRCAELPVFCVPESLRAPRPADVPAYRSVLIATDLSQASNQALSNGYGLLGRAGGRVELCHVHEGSLPSDPLRAEIERSLRALVPRQAEAMGITTNVSVVEGPSAARAILQAAKRLDVDVVVLGSHGRSGLRRALIGSVAEEVVRHADRPVLIVHQQPA
jgi:nucleotide-binding universal stress UspA family protein